MPRAVAEISFEAMSPELRALVAHDPNDSLDIPAPQAVIDRIRRENPVVRWEMGVGFFGLDDVVAAGRNPDLVSLNPETGENFGMGIAEPLIPLHFDGEAHRQYRRLLDPVFAPKRMAVLEPEIRKLADELIDSFIGRGRVELHDEFCVPLPSTIFLRLFGMPLEDTRFLIGMKDRILKNEGATLEEHERLGRAAGEELRAHLRTRLRERKAEGAHHDDLLDYLLHANVDGRTLSDEEIVNLMQMFTIAGLDTVTSSLSCIVAWFATHPDQRDRVVADPDLLGPAIEELMRFESPVPSSGGRWAAVDTEVNGVPIRKGELVTLCWVSGNLDSDGFERPLEVDLERAQNRHIAFAAGTHRCLGSHLARNELRCAIDQLHRRIPDYRVSEGDEIRYESPGVRQARHLPLSFTPGV